MLFELNVAGDHVPKVI